ncbi:hypothetical protein E6R60_26805 [Streptomyces sp. A0642]|uniref:hypothetical protein n=1 Tax=Streptomyces sp. A0642 TaxID=2563100 RepID=UPI0010A26A9E|nr:hypothetical protein [Streptomyces sp. A0642]THA72541.1 hypothetical protein E6R60_26805 [Streptomyces sp. A0642]
MTKPKPSDKGTCQVCGTEKQVNKDGTLRHHNGPSKNYGIKRCDGAGELPLETLPVTADTLETIVRGVARQAVELQKHQQVTFLASQLVRRLAPRLRELQGENAMLRDAVIGAKELVFEEEPNDRRRQYAEEALHGLAEDLLRRHPHLRRPSA